MGLKAKPGGCEEASPHSHGFYIPCNRPAEFVVDNGGSTTYRMCEMCTDHNVKNRGAKIVGNYNPKEEPTELNEEELRRLMEDPRYWRDNDPDVVQQVNDGFKKLYPDG